MEIINTRESKEFIESMLSILMTHGEVKITGLGIFRMKDTKPRIGRNPRTGEAVHIPARKRISFSPSTTIKKRINETTPQV